MTVRALDLLDLPTLHHYRNEVLGFDTARTLTKGNPLAGMGLMSHIMSPSRHIYGAIAQHDGASLLGGIYQTRGESFAKLLYLAPASNVKHKELPQLLENLTSEAGSWGAFHIVAEVEEDDEAFMALRQAGFSVYAWQRMWDVSDIQGTRAGGEWERALSIHLPRIQSLYQQIVPPLMQPVEPMPKRSSGLICNGEVRCFVSQTSGPHGIALHPLIHPEATNVDARLVALVQGLPNRRNRRVYMSVRSYQAWLENLLTDLGAEVGPRQALMVKHMAQLVKGEKAVRAKQPSGVSVQASRVSGMEPKK
jgi:hypothetical protein